MGLNERLTDYLARAVAYGSSAAEVAALAADASAAGCETLASVLVRYGEALDRGDKRAAAEYFAMLHIFTEA